MRWIYRVDDRESGKCVYVGQTGNPRSRKTQHNRKGRLIPLRQCADADALRIEGQVIVAYKKRGQAEYNTAAPAWSSNREIDRLIQAVNSARSCYCSRIDGFTVSLQYSEHDKTFCLGIDGRMTNCASRQNMLKLLAEWSEGKRHIPATGAAVGLLCKL